MPLPFGLKTPSRGTLIFAGIAGGVSGLLYTSNAHAEQSRKRLASRVSFLAEKPCGVLEAPRKVVVYISAPPGDGLEKSRNWFREYVKPVLVAGAVDYEVKEAKEAGQIEAAVIEEIRKRRKEADKVVETVDEKMEIHNKNPFSTREFIKSVGNEVKTDGVLAIGRNAYREVLSGLAKGCEASLEDPVVVEEKKEEVNDIKEEVTDIKEEDAADKVVIPAMETEVILSDEEEKKDHFSLPPSFDPVIYIPHRNIIGWTNIPYRLYMWYADYKRIEEVGEPVVAAVLNHTRPMNESDADKGQDEKKYWIGDEKVEELKAKDEPIVIDSRILKELRTYTIE
ncbi:mitochondrial import inner membrane translocase subunit Tim54 [Pilobolus umbonatus]|nr:mitochondrial import inner membrane translocase subunit Tim54 [Pilobolus umbonatus]